MLDNIKNKMSISPVVRLISLILILIILIVAKSIYLVLFMNTIILLISTYRSEKVNSYVKFIKKFDFILIFIFVIYIIIVENNFLKIIFIEYKLIIALSYIKSFEETINFDKMHEAIYGMLLPLKKINIDKIALNITLSLCLLKYWMDSGIQIRKLKIIENNISVKRIFNYRFNYSLYCLNKLQIRLNLNFYKLKYSKIDLKSKTILILLLLFFIFSICKEVIL